MAITIGSNIASLQAQRQLSKTDQGLSTVFERLSSGQRINRASDDAAGLAIADSLNVDSRVFNQGIRNLNDGISGLNIADGALGQLSEVVTRIRELSAQSANGVLGAEQREALNTEAQELSNEFTRIVETTEFNGQKLLNGDVQNFRLQAGYGLDGGIDANFGGAIGNGTATEVQSLSGNYMAVLGDIDSDGHLDLVTGGSGGNLSISYGDGRGGFSGTETLDTGLTTVRSVALDDTNNDGTLDIVAGGFASTFRHVSYLGNGDGSFTQVQTLGFSAQREGLELVDINNDGVLDIVGSGDGLGAALGNGDGTFTVTENIGQGGGNTTYDVDVGDLDGDGFVDAVVAAEDTGDGEVWVYIGGGDGTFTLQSTPDTANEEAFDVELGDVDGDGDLDYVAVGTNGSDVEVFLNDGSANFSSHSSFNLSSGDGGAVNLADLNNDGILDIVASNGSVLEIHEGQGDGTFVLSQSISSSGDEIAFGDTNEDGVLDIVTNEASLTTNTDYGTASILEFDLTSVYGARQAMPLLDRKLEQLAQQRGDIGAFQSRIEVAESVLGVSSLNYEAAESRIRDADVAGESSRLVTFQILKEAGAAVLSQANQQPALAIQLLR